MCNTTAVRWPLVIFGPISLDGFYNIDGTHCSFGSGLGNITISVIVRNTAGTAADRAFTFAIYGPGTNKPFIAARSREDRMVCQPAGAC